MMARPSKLLLLVGSEWFNYQLQTLGYGTVMKVKVKGRALRKKSEQRSEDTFTTTVQTA